MIKTMDTQLTALLVCPVTKGPLTLNRERQEWLSRSARLAGAMPAAVPEPRLPSAVSHSGTSVR